MITIAYILVFLWIKSHLLEKKNSSHTKYQLNVYNITGDINGRPVHTTRTYGPYGQKALHAMLFSVLAVRTGSVYRPLEYALAWSSWQRQQAVYLCAE